MNRGVARFAENLARKLIQQLKRAIGRSRLFDGARPLVVAQMLDIRLACICVDRAIPPQQAPEPQAKKAMHMPIGKIKKAGPLFVEGELIRIKGVVFKVQGIRPKKLILKVVKSKGAK